MSDTFRCPLLAYTSAIENPGIDLARLRELATGSGLVQVEKSKNGIRQEVVESYVTPGSANPSTLALFRHKSNSFAAPEREHGFYLVPVTELDLTIDKYIPAGGAEIAFLPSVRCTVVIWVDSEYMIMSLIVDTKGEGIATAGLTKLQHRRGLFVDDHTVSALRTSSPLFARLGPLERSKRNIGQLMGELLLCVIGSHYEREGIAPRDVQEKTSRIRERSDAILRSTTFITTVAIVDHLSDIETSNRVANVIGGYSGLSYKDPQGFIESMDLSPTPDIRLLIHENRCLVVAEDSYFTSSEKFNNGPDDWLAFGTLTGEVFSSLTASQYRFHLRIEPWARHGIGGQLRGELGQAVLLSTRLSDPNFVQTPLLRKMISRMIAENRLAESLASIRENINLQHTIAEGVSQRIISIMVLMATVLLLVATLIPRVLLVPYAIASILTIGSVYVFGPKLIFELDSTAKAER